MKCCDVHAGLLRHKVEIQEMIRISDGGGGYEATWQTVAKVWANIKPLSGNETMAAMQLEDRITHDIVIRYRGGVTAAQRIKYGDRLFNIRSVINVEERNVWMQLRAEEGVAV